MQRARCTDADPETFFPPQGDQGSSEAAAKAICRTCPVVVQCARYAIAHDLDGVWGALNRNERRRLRRAA